MSEEGPGGSDRGDGASPAAARETGAVDGVTAGREVDAPDVGEGGGGEREVNALGV